jgi:hypothetical protein
METGNTDLLTEADTGMVLEAHDTDTLDDATKWGRFFTIGSLVCGAIYLFFALAIGEKAFRSLPFYQLFPGNNAAGTILMISYIIVALVMLVFLLRFCILCRRAIATEDIDTFNEALASIKYYFIISGIVGLIYVFLLLMQFAKTI